MKRTVCGLLAMALLLGAGLGCKKQDISKSEAFSGVPLETVLENIYSEAALELPDRGTTEITAENMSYYFGNDLVEFTEAIASEALINVIPFSLCLLRVADAEKAEETAAMIRESADPNKWICVGVDGDKVVTDYAGDVVILIMAEQANELHAAFQRLAAA